MKILICALLCCSQLYAENYNDASKYKILYARVTYYWPGSGGQVRNITSTGQKAVCGKSAAVDPKLIPYGSTIYIPAMKSVVKAVDTGSAVQRRTASKVLGRNEPVIDIFCSSKAKAYEKIKKYPMVMKIHVKK